MGYDSDRLIQGLVANTLTGMGITGNIYYVSFAGDDSNPGTLDAPFKYPYTAMDACTDDHNDVIVLLPDNYNQDEAGADYPGNFVADKRGVIVMGLPCSSPGETGEINASIRQYDTAIGTGAATVPALTIQKPCVVMNIEFVTDNVLLPGVMFDDSLSPGPGPGEYGGFSYLKGCRFPGWGIMTIGVQISAGSYNVIDDCTFEDLTSGVTMDISLLGNPVYDRIENCRFYGCTSGIEAVTATAVQDFTIKGNTFSASTATAMTNAIVFAAGTCTWSNTKIINNNFLCGKMAAFDSAPISTTYLSGNTYAMVDKAGVYGNLAVNTEQDLITEQAPPVPMETPDLWIDAIAWAADANIAASGATLTCRLYVDSYGGTLTHVPSYDIVFTEGAVGAHYLLQFPMPEMIKLNWKVTIQSSIAPAGGAGSNLVKYKYLEV